MAMIIFSIVSLSDNCADIDIFIYFVVHEPYISLAMVSLSGSVSQTSINILNSSRRMCRLSKDKSS